MRAEEDVKISESTFEASKVVIGDVRFLEADNVMSGGKFFQLSVLLGIAAIRTAVVTRFDPAIHIPRRTSRKPHHGCDYSPPLLSPPPSSSESGEEGSGGERGWCESGTVRVRREGWMAKPVVFTTAWRSEYDPAKQE